MAIEIAFHPDKKTYLWLCKKGNLIPVYGEVLWDLETPVSAFARLAQSDYAFLLESVEGGEKWARYSFLGSNPRVVYRTRGRIAEIIREDKAERIENFRDGLEPLRKLLSEYHPVNISGLPRFYGGAVGYISYDMVRYFEKLPDLTTDELNCWDIHMVITDTIVIFDNVRHTIKVVVNTHLKKGDSPEGLYRSARERIENIVERLHTPLGVSPVKHYDGELIFKSNFTMEDYYRVVKKCLKYIKAGDIIQVVPSQRFRAPAQVDAFQLYRALRHINPSPYLFYLQLGGETLVGSSPEVLVRVEGSCAELRPIAGTRPRGTTPEEDLKLEKELLADPKELAEHIMLVDLGRNDLGRVCKIGTVKVTDLATVERYSHVMHIVSNVVGEVDKRRDCFDVFRASFPAGTLTGAPKIRAMEIIEELEGTKRGFYGGAVGYFSFSGNMDMCIAIRTVFIKDSIINIQAGGGVVADSVPEREYQETVNKAKALMRAVSMARKGLTLNEGV